MTPGFVRLPNAVTAALQRGDINERHAIILLLLHQWANHDTGRVDSFSAERVLQFLRKKPTKAAIKAMQRQVSGLRKMGWFHWDWVPGWKRPYHVWLHNYVKYLGGVDVADNVAEDVADETVLNPCKIIPYQQVMEFDVADGVPEKRNSMSIKHHKGYGQGEKLEDKNNRSDFPDVDAQADDLLAFIFNLNGGFTRPKSWALLLIRKFSLSECEYAIVEWMFSDVQGGDPSLRAQGFFYNESIENVLTMRRKEGRANTVPPKWKEALAQIEESKQKLMMSELLPKATAWLRDYLQEPRLVDLLLDDAKKASFGDEVLYRAKDALDVQQYQQDHQWFWKSPELPEQVAVGEKA